MTSTKSYTPHVAATFLAIGLAIFGYSLTGQLTGTFQILGLFIGAAVIGIGIFPDIATKDSTIERIDKEILSLASLLTAHTSTLEKEIENILSSKGSGSNIYDVLATIMGLLKSSTSSTSN